MLYEKFKNKNVAKTQKFSAAQVKKSIKLFFFKK